MTIEQIDAQLKELYISKEQIDTKIKQLEKLKQSKAKSYIVLKDAIYINTTYLSKELIDRLKQLATFDNPQLKILQSLRKPTYNTPSKIYSYNFQNNNLILPRGLMRQTIELFKAYKLDTTFVDKRFYKQIDVKKVIFQLRDEQQEAINNILKKDFALCIAPPGFGKTLIGSKMIELRAVNTLVIVNKNMLLDQWIDRFVTYFEYDKSQIGFLGKGKNKLNGILDIATMQSLKNNPDIIKQYSFVIVDECHHIPALTFEKIIKKFEGKYILGLSATPNRKDGMQPLIFQQLGQIAYEAKKKKSKTNQLKIIESNFVSEANNFAELINEMINNEQRNNLIIEQILLHKDRKILLLTDRIEHIENLQLLLRLHKLDFVSVHGSMSKAKQQENIAKILDVALVLATTSFFGEGIDFPHLDTIIFATPISYYGRLIQYLGRIGRDGSNCLAIDILDVNNRFALSCYKKRKDGYKQLHYKQINN
jgi:superfamily II DNA or RNA helicase